jgi:hypothetical protein
MPECVDCSRRGFYNGLPHCTYYARPIFINWNCDRLKAVHFPDSLEVTPTWDVVKDCRDLANAVVRASLRQTGPSPGTPEFEAMLTPADYEPQAVRPYRTIVRLEKP